ncbi:MAG TPA: glycosyltransferase family 2 protein [Smithellaceae bacterium]|nr:glycosyltransferase family 2 protein [Smithellaceae bacterium]HRS89402.1 glycosyltransferase family 2 protein [Smithellaceae bacterium]HRV26188.1 glycosyltransferase family 2 protein [Smithellaceae bacterium]
MKTAVIVTTYNRPDALALALDGYLAQKNKDFELVVADDGSTKETADLINFYKKKSVINIIHVWQEDNGFRAAKIRNKAIAQTSADYIIFSDGDCIPLPDFISQHKYLAEKNWFVSGSRVLLSPQFTIEILNRKTPVHSWKLRDWFAARLRNDINRILPFLSLPINKFFRKLWLANSWHGVMTCNMAVWREDLININGFDEEYTGWGLEDSDLTIRLLHANIKRKSARFLSPVLHLWHRENDRGNLTENRKHLNDLINSKRAFAILGIDQYL